MAGTGEAKKARLYIGSNRVINCKAYNERVNPNAEGHSDIGSDKVNWQSEGLQEYSVDVEVEIEPGQETIDPTTFNSKNPVDLLIIGPTQNRRYVQGVLTDLGISFREKETEKHNFTLGLFKDRVIE
jgi:hypothetical protein